MAPAPLPPDEPDRLAELRRYRILDTPREEGFDRITRLVARLLAVPVAQIVLVDAEREWVKSANEGELADTPRHLSFCAWSILGSETLVIEDCRLDARLADDPTVTCEPGIRFYAGALLRSSSGHNLGTMCVMDEVPRQLSDADRRLLEDAAGLVMDQLELRLAGQRLIEELVERKRAQAVIEKLAYSDALTGLANRRRFQERLEQVLSMAAPDRTAALAVIDLDHFKEVNDHFGHDAGDAVLIEVAARLVAAVRDDGVVARLGGDEFAIILPHAAAPDALQAWAEELAEALARPVPHGSLHLPSSASVGLAMCPHHATDAARLLIAADRALYRAKTEGRRRMCLADVNDGDYPIQLPSMPPDRRQRRGPPAAWQ